MFGFCRSSDNGVTNPVPAPAVQAAPKYARQPIVFVSHGPGPYPILGKCPGMWKNWVSTLGPIVQGANPRAICVISAHWQDNTLGVLAPPQPTLLYDYYGFPAEAYNLKYPCPGIPSDLTQRVVSLLSASFPREKIAVDTKRGLDHGTFVPLSGILPKADVPVFQVSLNSSMDYDWHVRLGHALAPLRDEGVLILGSGMTYHAGNPGPEAKNFNEFLKYSLMAKGRSSDEGVKIRQAQLGRLVTDSAVARLSKQCHPTPEHLIPLVVCQAAAGWGPAQLKYETPGAMDFVWDAAWPYDKTSKKDEQKENSVVRR